MGPLGVRFRDLNRDEDGKLGKVLTVHKPPDIDSFCTDEGRSDPDPIFFIVPCATFYCSIKSPERYLKNRFITRERLALKYEKLYDNLPYSKAYV